MVSALSGLPLCEVCSDPIEPAELEEVDGESFHNECAPARDRVLQDAQVHVIVGAVVRGTDAAAGQRAESYARQVAATLLALGALAGHPAQATIDVRRIDPHEQGRLL